MDELALLKQKLLENRPAAWESFPDIALYMDQVVSYMKRQGMYFGDEQAAITSAMINNYIKDGLVPRAQGKRYQRRHMVCLTAISYLKNVLSVRDMKLLLGLELEDQTEEEFYREFCRILDEAFSNTAGAIETELTDGDLARAALTLALSSCANKLACEQMLAILRDRNPEPEKGKKDQ